MKLRDELKNRADKLDAEMIAVATKRDDLLHEHNVLFMQRDDLERAIAALTPANTDEGWELEPETQAGVEIPEGFTKWEGGAFPFDFDDKVHLYLANGEYRWDTNAALWLRRFESGEVLAYHVIKASAQDETPDQGASESVVQTSPGEAEESRDQFEEEAALAAAIELTADVMQPEWSEREAHIQAVEAERYALATEGYAPVIDAYVETAPVEPEKKHRFSIFGHKRETEEVS